jgi:hypothetical protein
MCTNAILGGIADTTAQTITAVRERALRQPGGVKKTDTMAIEIHELDRKNPLVETELIPDSKDLPPPFDFERLARFMGYGFMMAPVQLRWFKFLSTTFPLGKNGGWAQPLKRVAFDQLIFAPAGELHVQLSKKQRTDNFSRYRLLLHSHDRRRRRRQTRCAEQTTGHVCPDYESQLHGLASGADHQLPVYAYSVPSGALLSAPDV